MSKNGEDRVLGHCPHARGIYSDNARTEPRSRTRTGEQQSWRRPRSADRGRLSWIGGTSPEGKFPMEPEEEWVRGPFRKETEDRTVWVGSDKVPEGTQERSGKGAVWTWARQDNYPTLSECEHVKARLSDKKGLYFEGGWGWWEREAWKDQNSTVNVILGRQTVSSHWGWQVCLPVLPPVGTCSTRLSAQDRACLFYPTWAIQSSLVLMS